MELIGERWVKLYVEVVPLSGFVSRARSEVHLGTVILRVGLELPFYTYPYHYHTASSRLLAVIVVGNSRSSFIRRLLCLATEGRAEECAEELKLRGLWSRRTRGFEGLLEAHPPPIERRDHVLAPATVQV